MLLVMGELRGTLQRLAWRVRRAAHPLVEVTPPPSDVNVEWDVSVALRDGVTLRLNVFRPITDDPVPVIMSAQPYGKDRIPARTRSGRGLNIQYRILPQPHALRLSAWTGWEAPDPAVWVPRGYAVVNADLRGSGTSAGTGHLFSDEEAHDYAELIQWAGSQSWCNGKVGLDGVSYLAISQYGVAGVGPDHLAAALAMSCASKYAAAGTSPATPSRDSFRPATAPRAAARASSTLAPSTRQRCSLDTGLWAGDSDPTRPGRARAERSTWGGPLGRVEAAVPPRLAVTFSSSRSPGLGRAAPGGQASRARRSSSSSEFHAPIDARRSPNAGMLRTTIPAAARSATA